MPAAVAAYPLTYEHSAPRIERVLREPIGANRPGGPASGRAVPALVVAFVAVIWGITFTVVDGATDLLPPADLVAWRFGIGTLALLLVRRTATQSVPQHLRVRAVTLGALLGAGFLLQAWAMTFTDALMSGFLTGLLVVIAPVAGWFLFRDRVPWAGWAGVIVACAGLAVLGWRETSFGPGELLTMLAAAAWGLHLVLLSRWARPQHALGLARIQLATVTGLALVAVCIRGLLTGGSPWPELPPSGAAWVSVLFLALVASAAAMVALSWAQARMSATRAAIILTLEPAAAGVTAAVMGAALDIRTVLGGSLLIVAMLVVEMGNRSGQFSTAGHRSRPGLPRGTGILPAQVELRMIVDSGHTVAHTHSLPTSAGNGDLDATVDRAETRVGERPY